MRSYYLTNVDLDLDGIQIKTPTFGRKFQFAFYVYKYCHTNRVAIYPVTTSVLYRM